MTKAKIDGVGPDTPIVVNERGGGQSHLPYRFDLFDGPAMFAMAHVLHQGAERYGANNWRKIDVDDHLNHAAAHIFAYLAGDRSDDHLSHLLCRAMFACAVALTEEKTGVTDPHRRHAEDICECGDYLHQHEEWSGKCRVSK